MRSVVVFPQPDGPRSAKNDPRGISSETPSTARTSANSLTTSSRRTSGAVVLSPIRCLLVGVAVGARAPVVELLPQFEIEERLRRDHLGQRPDAVGHVEQ